MCPFVVLFISCKIVIEDKDRIKHITEGFIRKFSGTDNDDVKIFSSPVRLEITGNHSDHQGGVILTGTVDADIIACATVTVTDVINILSEGYGVINI